VGSWGASQGAKIAQRRKKGEDETAGEGEALIRCLAQDGGES
jgi:hypothetical protein